MILRNARQLDSHTRKLTVTPMKTLHGSIPSLCLLFLLCAQSTHASDILCGKPGHDVEKVICASPRLTALDEQMTILYRRIESEISGVDGETGTPINRIKDEQTTWITTVRNQCASAQCLEDAYHERMARMRERWKDALP